jgi:alpha-galactosidase/6-phospho-beta-glucosidase family protein
MRIFNGSVAMNRGGMMSEETGTTAQEVAEVMEELIKYRERLVSNALETARRAKLKQSAVMDQIGPELEKIDAALQDLQTQQAALTANY